MCCNALYIYNWNDIINYHFPRLLSKLELYGEPNYEKIGSTKLLLFQYSIFDNSKISYLAFFLHSKCFPFNLDLLVKKIKMVPQRGFWSIAWVEETVSQ